MKKASIILALITTIMVFTLSCGLFLKDLHATIEITNDDILNYTMVVTVNGESKVFQTTRRDVKAEKINALIDKINDTYEVFADQEGLEGEQRENPIAERFTVGTKKLSEDCSSFSNTMVELTLPHKWGVRKNTNYTVVKIQRIEREA